VSLILDALNRSRQDANPVPGLATQHPVEQMTAEGRQYLVWVALAVALVVIAWLVMERFSAPPPPAADIGAPVAELSRNIDSAVNSVTTELKARAAAPTQSPQAVVAQPEPVAQVARPQVEKPEPAPTVAAPPVGAEEPVAATSPAQSATQDAGSAPVAPTTAPTLRAAENAAVAKLYQKHNLAEETVTPEPASRTEARPAQRRKPAAATDTSGVARAEQPIDIDRMLQQAREEVENSSLDDHPVPFLSSLSQQIKDDIPTLYYQRHDYSSDANLSSVVLNGATVKVGGSPLPGMKLEEILPDSVVLNYHGTQFRLRALNSWINL
jgi:general secretion pathway protein B